ncbi:MAG: chorismate mutase, partial [Candidatus Rokubacteria bacterium]|nr:chorismate mutase [Candidatus Rokubacteria bacterium]
MGLDEWRARIDAIDREVLDLLNQRADAAIQVGQIKQEQGAECYVPEREHELLERLLRLNPGPLPAEAIRAIWREIFSASLTLQRPLRIAYLGPEATFTHQAALLGFGALAEYLPARGIHEIFSEVERGRGQRG